MISAMKSLPIFPSNRVQTGATAFRKAACSAEVKTVRVANFWIRQSPGKAMAELDKACGWGCKKNGRGNSRYWKGYKFHLDVNERGIPVNPCVTEANVHGSQLAIPFYLNCFCGASVISLEKIPGTCPP